MKDKENQHSNFDMRKYLPKALIVFIYLASLVIFKEEWIRIIDFIWVDPIAGKFNTNEFLWFIIWGLFIVLIFAYYAFVVIHEKKSFRARVALLFVIISLFIFYSITSNQCVFNGIYTWFLIGLPIMAESVLCVVKYRKRKVELKNQDTYKGLEFEKPLNRKKKEIEKNEGYKRSEYAINTASILQTTFDNDMSFAVGISGKWGSGKTSFTNDLKELLEYKDQEYKDKKVDIIMEFNPWFCQSPDEIIEEFFMEYRSHISRFIPELSSKLNYYKKALQNIELHNSTVRFSVKNFIPAQSRSQLYREIKESLQEASIHVVIIIDDLDRLHKEEILEVLKLIRNTANFPYTQFIVTYDKDYVLKTLNQNIKIDYSEFLMKIFNLEIALPVFEDRIICDFLKDRIMQVCLKYNLNFQLNLLNSNLYEKIEKTYITRRNESNIVTATIQNENLGLYAIPQILRSMRDVIRFANSFELNLSSLNKTVEISEIDLIDFIYIELLRYRYNVIYDILKLNPLTLLYLNDENTIYQTDIALKSGSEHGKSRIQDEIPKYLIRTEDQKNVYYILGKLFDGKQLNSFASICNVYSYFTYFANRLDVRNIALAEFVELLSESNDNVLKKVEDWYSNDQKNPGQIEEKISYCLEKSIPIGSNQILDLDILILHNLILSLKKSKISSVENEINEAIINHFRYFIQTFERIEARDIMLKIMNLWIDLFDFVESVDEKINWKIIDLILHFRDSWLLDDFKISLSLDTKSIRLGEVLYKYLGDNMPNLQHVDLLVSVQKERHDNYLFEINTIDSKSIDLYCNYIDSARRVESDDNYIDKIRESFKLTLFKYPIAFVNANLIIEDNLLKFKLPLNKVLSNSKEINNFDSKITNSFKYEPEDIRARNIWSLFKKNDFLGFHLSPNAEAHKYSDNTYDFQVEVDIDKEAQGLLIELENEINKYNLKSLNIEMQVKIRDKIKQFDDKSKLLNAELKTENVRKLDRRILELWVLVPGY